MPSVSIIVPTLNAESTLKLLLASLKHQTVSGEIILVDSSSSDKTVEIGRSFGAKIITVSRDEFDHGGTRTAAGKAACGEVLIYMTQDVQLVNRHAVENLVKPFFDSNVGATYGRQLPHPDATPFAMHLRLFNYPENSYLVDLKDRQKYGIKTPFLSNSFAAYRRKVLEENGWFREKMIMGEDMYAGAKMLLAGYKISYASDAVVYHSHNYTLAAEFRRYFDIGVFHEMEKWMLDSFGKAEGEGIKFARSEVDFLIRKRKFHLLPEVAMRNGLKYLGYLLGRNYKSLPLTIISKLSMHNNWWYK